MLSSTLVSLISLVTLPLVAAHSNRNSRHSDAAKRSSNPLSKRDFSGQFTYFNDGMGACGQESSPSDFIVALNSAQYDGGKYCGQTITITYQGKSCQATIVDECPGCGYGGLDMSTGLFQFFAPESVGVLQGSWSFGSSGGGSGEAEQTTSSKYTPTTTSTHHTTSTKATTTWTPTTTSTHSKTHTTTSSTKHTTSTHSTTSSSKSSSSTSSTSSSSSAAATTSINYNSGAAAGLAQATGILSTGSTSNLAGLNQAFIGLAAVLVAAADEA